jgi:hypothetical protein
MTALLALDPSEIANDSGKRIVVSVIVTVVTAALSFVVGRYWGRYKARREWHSKEFLSRVIVSLNIFDGGTLKIRTVLERSIEEVFLNAVAIDKVMAAARKCTEDQPVLPIAKADRWYLLNYALNAVAEHFAAGQIRLDAGLPVTKLRYALFLTCEVVGEERLRKTRVMLVREDLLRAFPYPDTLPELENPWHATRVDTLRKAAALLVAEPDNFLMMEVCV